jgi:hypothetical protein
LNFFQKTGTPKFEFSSIKTETPKFEFSSIKTGTPKFEFSSKKQGHQKLEKTIQTPFTPNYIYPTRVPLLFSQVFNF